MTDSSRISLFAVIAAALLALALAFMAVSIKTGLLQFRDSDRVVSVKGLAERTVDAFGAMVEDGLHLDDRSVERLAEAQAHKDRWSRTGIWVGAAALVAIAFALLF